MRARVALPPLALLFLVGCGSEPIEITVDALPDGKVGEAYSFQLTAAGGEGDKSWTVSDGALPGGLQLSTSGEISGTPTEAGGFTFNVEVSAGDQTAAKSLSIAVKEEGPEPLAILTMDLLDARVAQAYERNVTAGGGTGEYAWAVTEGDLPPGLSLAEAGDPSTTISGTPTTEGDFTFTIQVSDAAGMSATKRFTLTVQPKEEQPFAIMSFILPDGVVGTPYGPADIQVVNVSPPGPVAWSVASGALPPGLVLQENGDPHTTVTGTPTVEGTYTFEIQAVDPDGDTDAKEFTVEIAPTFIPINIETASVATGTVAEPYSARVVARNGTGSGFSWSITGGTLPPGLSIRAVGTPDTLVEGTPTMAGTFTATVTVQDSNGDTASRRITFPIVDPLLSIDTPMLPSGDQGVAYNTTLNGSGGSGTGYAWSVSNGTIPPGLTLQASNMLSTTLSGTPTTVGVYDFTVELSDSGGQVATQSYSVPVYAPVEIVTPQLPNAQFGVPYTAAVTAQGGSGGYVFSVTTGALPPGLTLTSTGAIIGSATTPGSYDFTIEVNDDRSRSASAMYTVQVTADPPVIVTQMLPAAGDGATYAAAVTATGGSGTGYTWTIDAGSLPPGLNLSPIGTPTATISGSATTQGSYAFTIRVTDSFGGSATQALSIDVLPALTITTPALPARTECGAQEDAITATGGSGAGYAWSIVGAAPPGLQIDPSGTPSTALFGRATSPGTYSVTVAVQDDAGLRVERTFTLDVQAEPLAQRFVLLVGDLLVNNDTSVYVVDACGDQPGPPIVASPPAPGSGDASTDPNDAVFSPDDRRIAFVGDFLNDTTSELFVTTITGTAAVAPAVPASGAMVAGGDVIDLWWSPDSTMIAYLADQNVDGMDELFLVDVTNPTTPGTPIQISGALATAANDVSAVFWSPAADGLIYAADPTDGVTELFYVDLSNPAAPGAPVRVHPVLAAGQSCDEDVQWSPFGGAAVFRCDSATPGVFELWYVPITGTAPGTTQRASGTMAPGGDVTAGEFGFSPDGLGVAYLADQSTDGVQSLYLTVIFGGTIIPGLAVISEPGANEDVTRFVFGPNAVRGLIRADLDTDDVFDLYMIDTSGGFPVTPTRVNPPLVTGGDVDASAFAFSPSGVYVAYVADQDTNDAPELYVADVTGAPPWTPVKVSPALGGAGTAVTELSFSPDSSGILLRGDFFTDGQYEVAYVDLGGATPGVPQVLNQPLPVNGDVTGGAALQWRADGSGLFFEADMITNNDTEGWMVDLSRAAAGAPVRLHPAVPGNGDLNFLWLEP